MRIALAMQHYYNKRWDLAKQMGVTTVVSMNLPESESEDVPPWDYVSLLKLKKDYESAGLDLMVIEGNPVPINKAKLGLPGRDEEIKNFCELIENMGKLGIPILCYNFMAEFGWLRTSTITARGGALTTSFDYDLIKDAPFTNAGPVDDDRMWENFTYFLKRVVPVAEKAGVKLALHPDDPPLSPIRGVARIIRSVEAYDRVMDIVPSPVNGVALCQGNFALMTDDLPSVIRHFGEQGKIFFVHFRNVKGTKEKFIEIFHDEEGKADMVACMKAYRDIGFDGPIRPDHTPTMAGESDEHPGYETLGRLFAVGYMKGLLESVERLG